MQKYSFDFLGKKITDSFFIYKIEKRVPSQHKINIITQALRRKQTFLKGGLSFYASTCLFNFTIRSEEGNTVGLLTPQ